MNDKSSSKEFEWEIGHFIFFSFLIGLIVLIYIKVCSFLLFLNIYEFLIFLAKACSNSTNKKFFSIFSSI